MNKKIIFAIALGLLAALPASAAIIPACATGSGVPQLSCFLELALSVSKWILGITGSLALLFFVYGGFMFLTSSGKEQQITKGKTILTQAAIGIIIIFGAYIGVSFLMTAIGGKFTAEFNIEQPAAQTQNPAPAKESAYLCNCDYTKFDFQTKAYIPAKDPVKQYNSSSECTKNCDSLCKSTSIPDANPPGKYSGGQCQSTN